MHVSNLTVRQNELLIKCHNVLVICTGLSSDQVGVAGIAMSTLCIRV